MVFSGSKKGFSLVELLLCLGILTAAVIFIVDVFTKMLNASTKGADWTVATYIAASKLEQLLYDKSDLVSLAQTAVLNNGTVQGPAVVAAPGIFEPANMASMNQNTYYITYYIYQLTSGGASASGTDIYSVNVKVDWFERSPASSQGTRRSEFGLLSTKVSRLIYVH